ncbi:MAG: hypothetical protein FJ137_20455 [Deltaproteobacteria bacterium]|nr:hypothetical protein [Deltaproteobacteria bacterium]
MNKIASAALSLTLSLFPAAAACSAQSEAPASLPPAGLAGVPSSAAPSAPGPVSAASASAGAIDPSAPLPPGHPPLDTPHGGAVVPGGDDGAPLPPRAGQAPLPNFAGLAGGGGGDFGGGGAGGNVMFAGKVLEKLDVPQYTYLRIQTPTGEEWVAVSTLQVNIGDRVTVNQQLVMENFASKALGRTFARLVMGSATVGG